ncbi:hypothetical protein [Parapedobacter tibetensis]|uniref:hypothetical protein n=1 Tax=Parapedobacter tibetensis TaxID=2972951 RepID=UPI00214D3128|nr:hypothetical protein [Parapedobacter tibetensis]
MKQKKRFSFRFAATSLLCLIHFAMVAQNDGTRENPVFSLTVSPFVGYGISDTRYSIAGNEQGEHPNVLSELIWSDLKAIQYGVEMRGSVIRKIPFKIRYTRSDVFKGEVSDIDYAEDNRQAIFSEQYLSSHDGVGTHVNALLGYTVLDRPPFSISCLVGFDYLHQRAYLLNPRGTNSESDPFDYVEGLNSYYNTKWASFGASLWVDYTVFQPLSIHMDLGGYRSSYTAFGNWNLIKDFVHPKSYTHKGSGFRIDCEFKLSYQLNQTFCFKLGYNYQGALLRDGKDQLYLKSGAIQHTRLNEVKYRANSASLGIAYHFVSK